MERLTEGLLKRRSAGVLVEIAAQGAQQPTAEGEAADLDRRRVVIERVVPEIDEGRFPIRRVTGETVTVEADVFADGHDHLTCVLLFRQPGDSGWSERPMEPLGNDRWRSRFIVRETGQYSYTVRAWVDEFGTWQDALARKVEAGQDVAVELLIGAQIIGAVAARADAEEGERLSAWVEAIREGAHPQAILDATLDDTIAAIARRHPDPAAVVSYHRELAIEVERPRARFSTWYEMFPRSASPRPGRHGTFKDCIARLPYIAGMGFDVLYLPPIHPIGRTFRKGRNNTPDARSRDPGSPWAIGSEEGGHTAIHPQLGTLEEFHALVAAAADHGIEIALDLAFQCSPDHPWVREHPEWFQHRPDGTLQYAENPPKKYQDIYPFHFGGEAWQSLWEGLKEVVLYWVRQGVRIFRVDNPHTKPFPFWEWLIAEVRRQHPEVIFLSEAFTRPKVMYRLAKIGFTQSYTYFAWRNTKWELTEYFTELTQAAPREFFRPNLWPNTPDILNEYLQLGGRGAFIARLVLAAMLGANYGIYGPAFELIEERAREPDSEEYLDSEKYQLRHWNIEDPRSLRPFIARINRIRRENPELQSDRSLRFHQIDNDNLICFSKRAEEEHGGLLVVVNLDPHRTQAGWTNLALDELGVSSDETYQVNDLLTGARYLWHGSRNYVELDPHTVPAHVFRIRRRLRTERDFEYYL